jgi:peptidyl-prolyl cis-trans isomerase C
MKKTILPLLVAGTILMAGCEQQSATDTATLAPVVEKADAVAVVNGKYISKASLTALENEIAQRSHGQTFPKEKLIEELIQRELLVQDALQKQLDKSPEFIERMESARMSLLSQAGLQNFLKANPVTDAEIKAEYDNKVAAENGTEFKARHILVKTEGEAKKLIAQLDKGAKFADLATKHSTDTSAEGGDLGWFVASQMVEPFSKAVTELENGKYTKAPVQTQFGWHVILRENSRALTPPPLDAVKDQLMPFLQRQKVQNMIEDMRKQAKVEILVPLTDEQPKAEIPAAAEAEKAQAAEAKPAEEASKKSEEVAPAVEKTVDKAAEAVTAPAEKK